MGFYYTNNKKFNNEKYQNFDLNSKYRLNTEHKQYKSNKIFENINAKKKIYLNLTKIKKKKIKL